MSVRRTEFLHAMRSVANSVSIVTTDGSAGRHGATVSAFCSVSADPPTLLICLRGDSRIASRVLANGSFCVNVLDESAGHLAERFAVRGEASASDRFVGVELEVAAGAPWLTAVASAFSCRFVRHLTCGSHVIIIGEVLEVRQGSARPLARLDGHYGSVSLELPSLSMATSALDRADEQQRAQRPSGICGSYFGRLLAGLSVLWS